MTREPALIAGAIRAVILCAVAFGLRWSPEQIATLMLAVEAVLTLFLRSQVTPTAAPVLPIGTPVETPSGAPAVVNGAAPR